jgi:hypothetical protein
VIKAVVFDVGETLVDESREYGTWADWLGVPRHSFSAVFGAVIAQGRDYRGAFQFFRPGFSLDEERARRAGAGQPEWFGEGDLYPDARPAMAALREMGLWVGVAGNQTARAGDILRGLDLPADMIATSDDWGASKPGPGVLPRAGRCHAVRAGGDGLRGRPDRQRPQAGEGGRDEDGVHPPRAVGIHHGQPPGHGHGGGLADHDPRGASPVARLSRRLAR